MTREVDERDGVEIDAAMTVNQVIDRFPSTIGVFNAHGIDSCCGGAVPLKSAAKRDGVDVDRLLDDLRAAAGG